MEYLFSSLNLMLSILLIGACTDQAQDQASTLTAEAVLFDRFRDQSIDVYQPVTVLKLPLENGVVIRNPSVLERGPLGRIFAANVSGEIYSLVDSDGDGIEDTAEEFCNVSEDGFRTPTGLAFRDWDLYVGLPQQIRVYRDIDHDFKADTSFVFFEDIPFSDHPYEYTSGLTFDAKGWLYCSLTTDSWNSGASPDPKKYRGSILKISPDGQVAEQVASGIRSVHGMDINREGDIYFVDNQGGQNPGEELHMLREGSFYGYNSIKFGENLSETHPVKMLEAEVAPAEIEFSSMGKVESLFLTYYGPGEYWDRGVVTSMTFDHIGDSLTIHEEVIADVPKCSGLAISETGDLYVSSIGVTDYWYYPTESEAGTIYKIVNTPWVEPKAHRESRNEKLTLSDEQLKTGAFIFASRACASCHSLDGKTEMLGPSLENIGQVYSREELLEEISEPSKRMKPGDYATKIFTKDGEVYLGRVISQNSQELKLMLIGNSVKTIPVANIESSERQTTSMMYEGLLSGLEEHEIQALLDFLIAGGQ